MCDNAAFTSPHLLENHDLRAQSAEQQHKRHSIARTNWSYELKRKEHHQPAAQKAEKKRKLTP